MFSVLYLFFACLISFLQFSSANLDESDLKLIKNVNFENIKLSYGNSLSVLKHARKEHVAVHPFPHLVVKNCLSKELYDHLSKTYPEYRKIIELRNSKSEGSNIRLHLDQNDILSGRLVNISSVWKHFVKYHISQAFYLEVVNLFDDAMRNYLKYHEKILGKSFKSCKTGIRDHRKVRTDCDISTAVNVGVNTPSLVGGTSVRGEHLDRPLELYAGLLYFRENDDDSTGGALEILTCVKKPNCKKLSNSKRNLIKKNIGWEVQYNPSDLRVFKSVAYEENTLVFFLNGPRSFHKVSSRSKTTFPRRLVNIIADRTHH